MKERVQITVSYSVFRLNLLSEYKVVIAEAFISSANKGYSGVKMNTHGKRKRVHISNEKLFIESKKKFKYFEPYSS